jgi:hypothetical protein
LALAEREAQLGRAGKAARVASFVIDYATGRIQTSSGFAAIHGLAEETEELTCEDWRACVLPGDIERFEALRSQVFAERRRELNEAATCIRLSGRAAAARCCVLARHSALVKRRDQEPPLLARPQPVAWRWGYPGSCFRVYSYVEFVGTCHLRPNCLGTEEGGHPAVICGPARGRCLARHCGAGTARAFRSTGEGAGGPSGQGGLQPSQHLQASYPAPARSGASAQSCHRRGDLEPGWSGQTNDSGMTRTPDIITRERWAAAEQRLQERTAQ